MSIYEYDEELHMKQTREEGWEEGWEKGRLTLTDTILDFLKEMGNVSEDIYTMISNQKDSDILKQWIKIAAKVSSVEDFKQQILSN